MNSDDSHYYEDVDEMIADPEREAFDEEFGGGMGCDFPGECLMPGPHLRAECHTIEMVEAWNRGRTRGDF